jgi:NADH:ubiquinone oxidoreductase subunit 6 (subunit J)
MKKFCLEFLKRGLLAAGGGPIILAIIYGILGANGTVTALTPNEVCKGILSITLMAFIAAGIQAIYQIERLPIISAILIHGAVLYIDYLIMYLMNDWIPRNLESLSIFTIIFVVGYVLIWVGIYLFTRYKTHKLNQKLNK